MWDVKQSPAQQISLYYYNKNNVNVDMGGKIKFCNSIISNINLKSYGKHTSTHMVQSRQTRLMPSPSKLLFRMETVHQSRNTQRHSSMVHNNSFIFWYNQGWTWTFWQLHFPGCTFKPQTITHYDAKKKLS